MYKVSKCEGEVHIHQLHYLCKHLVKCELMYTSHVNKNLLTHLLTYIYNMYVVIIYYRMLAGMEGCHDRLSRQWILEHAN